MDRSDTFRSLFLAAVLVTIVGVVAGLTYLWPGLPQNTSPAPGATEERLREEYHRLALASQHQPNSADCSYHAKILALSCLIPRHRGSDFGAALRLSSWEYLGESSHGDRFRKNDLSVNLRCTYEAGDSCELSFYRVLKR
jgi:hypothetical protein